MQAQHAQLSTDYAQLDVQTKSVEASLGTTHAELKRQKDNYSRGARELDSRKTQEASLTLKIGEVQNDTDALTRTIGSLDNQLTSTRGTFASTKSEREERIRELGVAIEERKTAQRHLESELRDEFQNKLTAFIEVKCNQYNEDKKEWMNIFRDEYNKKILMYKTSNMSLGSQIQDLLGEKRALLSKIMDRKNTISQMTMERRGIEADIDARRADFDRTSKTIRDLKAALARKKQEYDELLAARIQLENEVKQYASVVSDEEKRVGLDNSGN